MRFMSLHLRGYHQFDSLALDFTHPDTHRALDTICFIGPNGTGKTTILNTISKVIRGLGELPKARTSYSAAEPEPRLEDLADKPVIAATVEATSIDADGRVTHNTPYLLCTTPGYKYTLALTPEATRSVSVQSFLTDSGRKTFDSRIIDAQLSDRTSLAFKSNAGDLLVTVPAPHNQYTSDELPESSLQAALALLDNFPCYHRISQAHAKDFWTLLVYHIRQREIELLRSFAAASPHETLGKLTHEVDSAYGGYILQRCASIFDAALRPAGLTFDVDGAVTPRQMKDNLQVHIRHIHSQATIPYGHLSAGIRSYLFTLGHLVALFLGRRIDRGVVLVDEPENSLYPTLLYDLIDRFRDASPGSQRLFATHSPIVAAQVASWQRIVLSFDEDGYAAVSKGVSPTGDDTNDVLLKDFRVDSVYGRVGLESWRRFLELRRQLQSELHSDSRDKLLEEYAALAAQYGFGPNDAIPSKAE